MDRCDKSPTGKHECQVLVAVGAWWGLRCRHCHERLTPSDAERELQELRKGPRPEDLAALRDQYEQIGRYVSDLVDRLEDVSREATILQLLTISAEAPEVEEDRTSDRCAACGSVIPDEWERVMFRDKDGRFTHTCMPCEGSPLDKLVIRRLGIL